MKWRQPGVGGAVEDVAAAGLMADNRGTQSQSASGWLPASLYLHNNRNLVWNSEPSQTWSHTCYLAHCGHTHTSSLTSFTCEFCQCHLASPLRGPVLTPARGRSTQLPNHDKWLSPPGGLRGVVAAQIREEAAHRRTARWPPSLSFRRDGFVYYDLWFTFESSQKTDFNLTRFHLYCFRLAAHVRPLMFWCPCFHLQHTPSVPRLIQGRSEASEF